MPPNGHTTDRNPLEAANSPRADPIKHLINTIGTSLADGNEWPHDQGAAIFARENRRKHPMATQRVEDWNSIFCHRPPQRFLPRC